LGLPRRADRPIQNSESFFVTHENSAPFVDLFGDPVPANFGRRGRPEHMPTLENQNRVKMLLALGWANARIAKTIGITQPTLRKHYKFQLRQRDEMRDRLEASYVMRVWKQVEDGNVAAMRVFRDILARNDLMHAETAMAEQAADKPGEIAAVRVGKKLAAQAHAIDVDADLNAELESEAAAQDARVH
jgi:hypothetical protein